MVERSTRRARVRARGGAAVVALVSVLGASACLPSPVGQCTVAGQEPVSVPLDDLAVLSDALEARFPTCFGGVVRTGPQSADVYAVGSHPPVLVLAQQLAGPTYTLTVRSSDHPLADVRALKHQIDDDAGALRAAGIPVQGTGITIVAEGPRVLVGLDPDSPQARAALEQLYGASWLLILAYGPPTHG